MLVARPGRPLVTHGRLVVSIGSILPGERALLLLIHRTSPGLNPRVCRAARTGVARAEETCA